MPLPNHGDQIVKAPYPNLRQFAAVKGKWRTLLKLQRHPLLQCSCMRKTIPIPFLNLTDLFRLEIQAERRFFQYSIRVPEVDVA